MDGWINWPGELDHLQTDVMRYGFGGIDMAFVSQAAQ